MKTVIFLVIIALPFLSMMPIHATIFTAGPLEMYPAKCSIHDEYTKRFKEDGYSLALRGEVEKQGGTLEMYVSEHQWIMLLNTQKQYYGGDKGCFIASGAFRKSIESGDIHPSYINKKDLCSLNGLPRHIAMEVKGLEVQWSEPSRYRGVFSIFADPKTGHFWGGALTIVHGGAFLNLAGAGQHSKPFLPIDGGCGVTTFNRIRTYGDFRLMP